MKRFSFYFVYQRYELINYHFRKKALTECKLFDKKISALRKTATNKSNPDIYIEAIPFFKA